MRSAGQGNVFTRSDSRYERPLVNESSISNLDQYYSENYGIMFPSKISPLVDKTSIKSKLQS